MRCYLKYFIPLDVLESIEIVLWFFLKDYEEHFRRLVEHEIEVNTENMWFYNFQREHHIVHDLRRIDEWLRNWSKPWLRFCRVGFVSLVVAVALVVILWKPTIGVDNCPSSQVLDNKAHLRHPWCNTLIPALLGR